MPDATEQTTAEQIAKHPLQIFRGVFAPELPTLGLQALSRHLCSNSELLTRGITVEPLMAPNGDDFPIGAACPIGLALWLGNDFSMCNEVAEAFEDLTNALRSLPDFCDIEKGVQAFYSWWDEPSETDNTWDDRERLLKNCVDEILRERENNESSNRRTQTTDVRRTSG